MGLSRSILSPCHLALNTPSATLPLGPKRGHGQLWLQDTLGTPLSILQVTRIYLGFVALLAPMHWITFHHFWHPAVDAGSSRPFPRPGQAAGGAPGSMGALGGSLPAVCRHKTSSCPGPANVLLLLGLFMGSTWSCFINT